MTKYGTMQPAIDFGQPVDMSKKITKAIGVGGKIVGNTCCMNYLPSVKMH